MGGCPGPSGQSCGGFALGSHMIGPAAAGDCAAAAAGLGVGDCAAAAALRRAMAIARVIILVVPHASGFL
eukprot:COSAG04_NODE_11061_length_733_cov_1.123028_1_plen_70_part_00